jgi:protein disulfide-isomerase
MKKLIITTLAIFLGISVLASGKEWMTDMDAAMKLSVKDKKPILVKFSGSDWCPGCMQLDKEIFAKKVFKDFAKEKLILVLIDFPRWQQLPYKQRKKNQGLAEKYKVEVFPTVFLLDGKGKVIANIDFNEGDAQDYVDLLKKKMPKETETAKK